MDKKERYSYIIENELYKSHLQKIEEYEKERVFCHHDPVHFMDVARIGMILNLNEKYHLKKDVIYAAALLHDIGRDVQYMDGTPHEKASVEIAKKILSMAESDYSEKEKKKILKAIENHRNEKIKNKKNLSGLLYRADKLSRPCYFCKAFADCNWKGEKKNKEFLF